MKQVVAQVVVAAITLTVVGFFVWLVRAKRASVRAGQAQLETLAAELGTSYTHSRSPRLEGTWAGRPVTLIHAPSSVSGREAHLIATIRCRNPPTLEVFRNRDGLSRISPPDLVKSGDAEFDAQLSIRTSDPALVPKVFTPDLRRELVERFKRTWVDGIYVRDGSLTLEGGFGLIEGVEVERARALLRIGVEISAGLDR